MLGHQLNCDHIGNEKLISSALTVCLLALGIFSCLSAYAAAGFSAGAAPKGDAQTVAARIIKYNFPQCKRVTNAIRRSDGTIRASCDGVSYYVFTLYVPRDGKMHEIALNCVESKQLLNIECPR